MVCDIFVHSVKTAARARGIDLLPGNWSEFIEKFPVRFGDRRIRESVNEDVEV